MVIANGLVNMVVFVRFDNVEYRWNDRVWYLDSTGMKRKARITSINVSETVVVNLNIRDEADINRILPRSEDDYSDHDEYDFEEYSSDTEYEDNK